MKYTVPVSLFLIFTGLFTGCGQEEHNVEGPPKVTVDPATVKKILPVTVDDVYRSVGTVLSKNTTQIAGKVMGHVKEVKVKEGDKVKRGDLLIVLKGEELKYRLESARNAVLEIERRLAEAEAAKEEAEAQLGLTKTTLHRFKNLLARESVTPQEFDEVKAKYDVATARVKRAEKAIGSLKAKKQQVESSRKEASTYYDYTQIKAPFSGLITQKMIYEGDMAIPGNTLLVLEDNQHYQLETFVEESKIKKISVGQEAEVRLDALGQEQMKGRVAEIVPHIDPGSRTFKVKIDLSQVSGIKSGMYGKAYFPIGKTSLLLVPKTALAECGQLSSLYIVNEESVVERRLVKVGKDYDDKVEILSGLDPGELVVVHDLVNVTEGCLVGKRP